MLTGLQFRIGGTAIGVSVSRGLCVGAGRSSSLLAPMGGHCEPRLPYQTFRSMIRIDLHSFALLGDVERLGITHRQVVFEFKPYFAGGVK